MAAVYSEYTRDRVGMFFGLTGVQLAILVAAAGPTLWMVHLGRWPEALGMMLAWCVVFVLVVVPVRGRSATAWLLALAAHLTGVVLRWTPWRSKAATGTVEKLDEADLPGILNGVRVHDGPPQGATNTRVALIQNHASRSWAVTAAITHAGLALADDAERDAQAKGLTAVINACTRNGNISHLVFTIRSTPDDGAERREWLAGHQPAHVPNLARVVNNELAITVGKASVRTEQFITVVVPEAALTKQAKEFGRGLDGRARAMSMVMTEVAGHLRDQLRVSQVDWLTSPQLAAVVRSGFAPGDRAGIVEALAARATDDGVNADVPWAQAAAAGADTAIRHYRHDAWQSISATLQLPDKGARIGALASVVVPTEFDERRCLAVVYSIVPESVADRQAQSGEWKADLADSLRTKAGVRSRARDRIAAARARGLDGKLASGNALVRPYAVASVTVPATAPIAQFGRLLDTSIRRAGFAPLRLDMSQDAGFAAATIPLGVILDQQAG